MFRLMCTTRQLLLMTTLLVCGCAKPTVAVHSPAIPAANAADDSDPSQKTNPDAMETGAQSLGAGVTFPFSDDAEGKLLARLLPPAHTTLLAPLPRKGPSERILPPSIIDPVSAPLKTPLLPTLPSNPPGATRPMPLPEKVPIDLAPAHVVLPERITFRVGPLVKIEAPDVKQPVAVPILAQMKTDRASLDDPTIDFSNQSIISDNLPLRSTPAPFVKVNLPDPFENIPMAKAKIVVKDDPATALGNPPPPKP